MELAGSITENLYAAIVSAKRLRGHHVYADTVSYWQELVHSARRSTDYPKTANLVEIKELVAELESELADRSRWPQPGQR